MPLKKCRECEKEVSTSAKECPSCGAPKPTTYPPSKQSQIGTLVFFIAAIIFYQLVFGDDSDAEKEPSLSDTQCKKELSCWAEKGYVSATVYCSSSVEDLAKNSHQWTDSFAEPKFSHYRWKDSDNGFVTYIGDKIQYQNGFGAWINYTYECDFDPNTETVLDVRARQGKMSG
jgi:hypothetical protein